MVHPHRESKLPPNPLGNLSAAQVPIGGARILPTLGGTLSKCGWGCPSVVLTLQKGCDRLAPGTPSFPCLHIAITNGQVDGWA